MTSIFKPWVICTFIFCTNLFGIFNVLHVRKELFILSSTILVLWFLYDLSKNRIIGMSNLTLILWGLILLMAMTKYLILGSLNWVIYYFITFLAIILIYNQSNDVIDRIIKLWIKLSTLFSALVIVQFILYLFDPSIFIHSSIYYDSASHFNNVTILTSIGYLGQFNMGAINTIMNTIEIPRFYSFAPEPSALVMQFLIPALLAFTYRGVYIFYSSILLFTIIILTSSGTTFLTLAIGLQLFMILNVVKFIRVKGSLSLWMITSILMFQAVYFLSVSNFSFISEYAFSMIKFSSIFVSQEESYFLRTLGIMDSISIIMQNPFGSSDYGTTATGSIISIGVSFGIIGLIIGVIIYYRTFIIYFNAFFRTNTILGGLGIAIIIGALFQSAIFSGYEWMSGGGFIVLLLLHVKGNMINSKENI
jgi:hypothetical protein